MREYTSQGNPTKGDNEWDSPSEIEDLIEDSRNDREEIDEQHLGDKLEPDSEAALSDPVAAEFGPNRFKTSMLGEGYGPVRAFFKRHPDRYQRLQRRLNQARIPLTYDQYLVQTTRRSVQAAVLGGVLGLLVVALSSIAGPSVVDVYRGGVGTIGELDPGSVALFLAAATVAGLGFGGASYLWLTRFRPRQLVTARRREINLVMPYTVTFLYALTDAGSDLLVAIETVADADNVYGEAALEFDRVVREMELFGNDLQTALRNTGRLSPSAEFEDFVDDLLSVLSAGGEIDRFLGEEVDDRLDTAAEEQAAFVETLALLSEGFVVGFVAAPLFLIVVLIVVSFLGADTIEMLAAIIYVLFPLGIVLYIFLIDIISGPFMQPPVNLDIDPEPAWSVEESELDDDPRFRAHQKEKRARKRRNVFNEGVSALRQYPPWAFVVSVPVALAVVATALLTGFVELSIPALVAEPFKITVVVGVIPSIIATAPVSFLHERRARRKKQITNRFPDLLELLASTNRMGIEMTDSVRSVSQWASGRLGTELKHVENDMRWNNDMPGALLRFADRIDVPQLSRTMKLITEGSRVTSNLHEVLDIAAQGTRAHARTLRKRERELSTYLAIVVIGFLVYLLVVGVISEAFFTPIEDFAAEAAARDAPESETLGLSIPVDVFRTLFFHSTLLQAAGSGILAGKLSKNSTLSGLKYGIPLVITSTIVFAFIL